MYTVKSNNVAIAKPANQALSALIYAGLDFFKVNPDLIGCQELPPGTVQGNDRRIGQTLAYKYKLYDVMMGERYSLAHKRFYLIEHADVDIVQALLVSAEHANKTISVVPHAEDSGYKLSIERFDQYRLDALSFAVLVKKHAVVDVLLTLNPGQLIKSLVFLKTMAEAFVTRFRLRENEYLVFSAKDLAIARLALLLKLKPEQRYLCNAQEQTLVANHLFAELATLTDSSAVTQFWATHQAAAYLMELPSGHPGALFKAVPSSHVQVKLAVQEKLATLAASRSLELRQRRWPVDNVYRN